MNNQIIWMKRRDSEKAQNTKIDSGRNRKCK